jgi:hypothetical protein
MEIHMKKCFKCREQKPLSDFYKHRAMSDGHLNKCISCTKKDVFERRHGKDREKILAYDRERAKNQNRIDKAKKIYTRWKEQFPERRKAQLAVQYALRSGKLKPLPCFSCGEKAEAHHPDYDRPLDVVWLCSSHHKQTHAIVYAERNK